MAPAILPSSSDSSDSEQKPSTKQASGEEKQQDTTVKVASDAVGLFDEEESDEEPAKPSAATAPAEEDEDKPDEKEEKSDKDENMQDLFGSDYESEEEFEASDVKESTQPVHHSTFADTTDAVRSTSADSLSIPKLPKHQDNTDFFVVKMQSMLAIQTEEATDKNLKEEYMSTTDDEHASLYRNTIRWRRDPSSGERQTNTKLVQWDDGSYSLVVGQEFLRVTKQSVTNSFVFVNQASTENDQHETILECHAPLSSKFTIRPMSIANKSHQNLTMSVRSRRKKTTRGLKEYITEADPDLDKQTRAKRLDDQLRLQSKKRAKEDYESDRRRGYRMDADFLEEGYEDMEYDDDDLSAIKEQYSGRRSKKRLSSNSSRRRARISGGFDEYEDEIKHREEESDEEEEDMKDDDDEEDDEEDEIVNQKRPNKKRKTVLLDDDDDDE